jgi:hypothetical protein
MRLPTLLAVLAILCMSTARPARADEDTLSGNSVGGTLIVMSYVIPLAGSLITTSVNGAHISYDEPPPRRWRITGYVFGVLELAIGGAVLAVAGDTTAGKIEGIVPLTAGIASIATAYFAPRGEVILGTSARLAPIVAPDGGALVLTLSF